MSGSGNVVTLSAADYAVFGVLLGVSAAVGIFFAYRDRKVKNLENYLLGDRNISAWASGFSASLSFLSGVSVIGIPAEMAYFGGSYVWFIVGILFSVILSNEIVLPIYYTLGLASANEYYGLRFGKFTRYVGTVLYLIQTVTYSGVMIYAPALALNAVSNFSLWGAIVSVGVVCTLYTTLGGLKAVIWTDVIQGLLLIIVLFVVLFKSADSVGGLGEVFRIANDGGRLDFSHFEFDPRYRMTFWTCLFGLGFMWTSITTTNQAVVQRFICCKSVTDGKIALYFSWPVGSLQVGVLCLIGFTAYAYFAECDPVLSGKISAGDQMVPYMVLTVFQDLPGLSGLFIAGIFAAALSTISSAINGMSCVTINDLIKPNVNWSETKLLWLSRASTVIYGALCIAFAYVASTMGGVVEATVSLLGLCTGALLGPIAIGILFSFANEKGAISGMLSAFAINIWIYVGSTIYPPPVDFTRPLNLSVEACPKMNRTENETISFTTMATTFSSTLTSVVQENERPAVAELYAVSFTYYSLIGLAVCMLVGLIVSCATGGLKSRYRVDPKLMYFPFDHVPLRWLPESFRRFMRPKTGSLEDFKSDVNRNCQMYETQNGEIKNEMERDNCHKNTAYVDDDNIISTAL